MEKEIYKYTLNALKSDCARVESATATLAFLTFIEQEHPLKPLLTEEMREAFKSLYEACSAFCLGFEEKLQ